MSERARLYRAALRRDLLLFIERCFSTLEPGTPFQPNWHLEHLAYALQQVAAGRITRLIINVPPRWGKSLLASIALPAPTRSAATYSAGLSTAAASR